MKKKNNEIEKFLDINDFENFDKEYAHVCYIHQYLKNLSKSDNMYTSHIYYDDPDQMDVLPWDNDRGDYYENFFKFYISEYNTKNYNFWIKGFVKYKDL